jgi:hypothetical protein
VHDNAQHAYIQYFVSQMADSRPENRDPIFRLCISGLVTNSEFIVVGLEELANQMCEQVRRRVGRYPDERRSE